MLFGSRLEVKRFEKTVEKYESVPVQKGRILFYGHSLFTRCSVPAVNHWGNLVLEDEVRGKDGSPAVLNHGFGTSSADDLLYYYPRLVRPYEPRALVLVTGNNDFGFGYSPEEVADITARVIDYAQADFPGIPVYYLVYAHVKQKGTVCQVTRQREEYAKCVELVCAERENCHCIRMQDQPFLFDDPSKVGNVDEIREDLYVEDRVHFNPEGYRLFMDFVRDMLSDLL